MSCPPNSFVAQPGFKVSVPVGDDPNPYLARVSQSPTRPAPTDGRGGWTSHPARRPSSSSTTRPASGRRSWPAGGESHKLVYRYQPQLSNPIPPLATKTVRLSCKDTYKAMVAGFRFVLGDLYYLGMDPQPKSRDFKFTNPNGVSKSVDLAAICLNYRTT